MGQVTIYLDAETEQKMRRAAEGAGLPQSRWIARLIERETAEGWPQEVTRLAGAWTDLPTAEELRLDVVADAKREPL
jgi:hypothetical protein